MEHHGKMVESPWEDDGKMVENICLMAWLKGKSEEETRLFPSFSSDIKMVFLRFFSLGPKLNDHDDFIGKKCGTHAVLWDLGI